MGKASRAGRTGKRRAQPAPRREQQALDQKLDAWRLDYANRVLRDPNDPPWKLGSDIPRFEALREQFAALAVELRHYLDALERAAADPLAAGAGAILGRALHGGRLSDERRDGVVGILLALEDTAAAIRADRHRRPKK